MMCKYFLPFSRLPFYFVVVSFAVQKLFSYSPTYLFFLLLPLLLVLDPKIMTKTGTEKLTPMVPSRNFMISDLVFRSLIHFVYGVR